jgi:uncharacterized membrane protein
LAKKRKPKRQRNRNRNQGIARPPADRVIDPAIDGEYVDPNVTISGNVPANNPVRTTIQNRRTTVQTQAMSFQGPIPPPELLREYNEIVPDGADRIVKMAEAQSAHRIELESIVVKGDDRRANWGLVTGFTIGIVIIVLSFILILFGHDVSGTILGSVDLIGLIGVFVYGRSVRMKELQRRDQKNQALTKRR